MKRVLFLLLAVCVPLFAQGTKLGIVDADVVIQESAKGKKFFEEYKKFSEGKRGAIEALAKEYRDKEKDYQTKLASLSEDKRKELAADLARRQTDIKRMQEDAQRESDGMVNDNLEKFRRELAPLIRQVALEKGLDMVMNYGPQSNIVYFSDAINITDEVIKKYDAAAPTPEPAAAKPPKK